MITKKLIILLGVIFILRGTVLNAAIEFDEADRSLWITDFSKNSPCTVEAIVNTAKLNDWKFIRYNPDSDTCEIDAHVYIGTADGTETYFQLGDHQHSETTLIVKGNLVVYPTVMKKKNSVRYPGNISKFNKLTIGKADSTKITATLKISGDLKNRFGIYVSAIPEKKKIIEGWGGEITVYNGAITSLIQDRNHAIDRIVLAGANTQIINSKISWVRGAMTYALKGYLGDDLKIENTLFENGGIAVCCFHSSRDNRFKRVFRNCEFRNCEIAVDGRGGLGTFLDNCTFTKNNCNWRLTSAGGLELVDCSWTPPLKRDEYSINEYCQKKGRCTRITSQRHIIISVLDEEGKPIQGATVKITSKEDKIPKYILTDKSGETPGVGSKNALQLTEFINKTTNTPNQLIKKRFSYDIEVTAKSYQTALIKNFNPQKSWEIINIKLVKR